MDISDQGDCFYKVKMYLHEVGGVSFLKIPAVLLCFYALKWNKNGFTQKKTNKKKHLKYIIELIEIFGKCSLIEIASDLFLKWLYDYP